MAASSSHYASSRYYSDHNAHTSGSSNHSAPIKDFWDDGDSDTSDQDTVQNSSLQCSTFKDTQSARSKNADTTKRPCLEDRQSHLTESPKLSALPHRKTGGLGSPDFIPLSGGANAEPDFGEDDDDDDLDDDDDDEAMMR